MKCRDIEELIEDYGYGELNPTLAHDVAAHIAACSHCSSLHNKLRQEEEVYNSFGKMLDSALEISPSAWNKVHDALITDPTPVGYRPRVKGFLRWSSVFSRLLPGTEMARQMIFASILMLVSVCGTLLVVHYYRESKPAPLPEQRSLQSALHSIERAEQEYIEAISVLNSIVETRKAALDPSLAAELQRNLKSIDEVIASTRRVYLAHPVDPELAQYMLAAYRKKVELLQEMAQKFS